MVSLVAKIEYVIINSNWMHEIMAEQKRSKDIQRDFLNITSAGLESVIVTKRHLLLIDSGHGLGIWICGCSLFYRRELWASKSAGANST
jgi:hypothetical protein